MSTRLVEIIVPDAQIGKTRSLVARHCRRYWQEPIPGEREKFSCIVQKRYVERLLGRQAFAAASPDASGSFDGHPGGRVVDLAGSGGAAVDQ